MSSQSEANSNSSSNRQSRRYVFGLVVIHILLTLFAILTFAAGFPDYKWPRWQSIFIEALACSQIALSAMLFVIATVRLSLRIVALAIVVVFWVIVFLDLGLDHEDWLAILGIAIAGICSVFLFVRLLGVRLVRGHDIVVEKLDNRKYRFSLRQMLLWMAASSFLLGFCTLVWRFQGFQQPSIDWGILPRSKVLGMSLPPIMLVAVWAALGTTRKIMPLLLVALVIGISSLAAARTDQLFRTAWWSTLPRDIYPAAYLCLVWACGGIVYLSLIALRLCGYRVSKR